MSSPSPPLKMPHQTKCSNLRKSKEARQSDGAAFFVRHFLPPFGLPFGGVTSYMNFNLLSL